MSHEDPERGKKDKDQYVKTVRQPQRTATSAATPDHRTHFLPREEIITPQ